MLKTKNSAKIFLAIFLTFAMIVSLMATSFMNVTANTGSEPESPAISEEVPKFEQSANAQITLGDGKVDLKGEAGDWVSVNLDTALPEIIMKPVLNTTGAVAYFAVTNGGIVTDGEIDYTNAKGLVVKLVRTDDTTLSTEYYDTATSTFVTGDTFTNYDFDAVHNFSWGRWGYDWRLSIDTAKSEVKSISEYVYELGANSIFTFFGNDNEFEFINVKIKGNTGDSFTETASENKLTVTGDLTTGYTLSSTADSTLATYNKAFNFETTEISFKSADLETATANRWFGFIISSSYGGRCYTNNTTPSAPDDDTALTGDSVFIGFKRHDGGVYVNKRGASGAIINLLDSSSSFDYSDTHTISFKNVSGVWRLCLDGTVRNEFDFTPFVKNLADKKVFYTVSTSAPSPYFSITNVKFNDLTPSAEVEVEEYGIKDTKGTTTVSGDERTGYTVTSTQASTLSSLKTPIDLNTQGFQFKNNFPNQWSTIVLSNSYSAVTGMTGNDDNNILRFMIQRANDSSYMQISYGVPAVKEYGKVYSFKWDEPHTYQFVKASDGYWDLLIDGKALTVSSGKETDHQNARVAMSSKLEELAKGKAYLYFGNYENVASFYNVKRANFVVNNTTMVQTGNSTDGYNIEDTATTGRAVMMAPIKIGNQTLTYKQEGFRGGWTLIRFTENNYSVGSIYGDKTDYTNYNFLNLMIYGTPENKKFELHALYRNSEGTLQTPIIGTITNFEWSEAHTLSFVKNPDGNWKLTVDGIQPEGFTYDTTVQEFYNTQLEVLSQGNAYVEFATSEADGTLKFSGIKINTPVEEVIPKEFSKIDYIARSRNSLKLFKKLSDGNVIVNIYAKNSCIYSNELTENGLDFKLSNYQPISIKLVYEDGETEIVPIYSAGNVNEHDQLDIRSLVALAKLVESNGSTYNSNVDGLGGTDSNDIIELRKCLLNIS